MRRYAAKGYTIAFPHKWDVPPSGSATGMVALSPQEGAADLFRENVIVVVDDLPEGATLDVYRRNGR